MAKKLFFTTNPNLRLGVHIVFELYIAMIFQSVKVNKEKACVHDKLKCQ